jgi:murein DD-endopeptidase MepM/ murein hydrolase activator NlpD
MYRNILLIILTIILESCSNINKSQKLLNKINDNLQTNYGLKNGALIARYNLAKIDQGDYLYAKDFGQIVNNENYNKVYLQKFNSNRSKHFTSLNNEALIKIARIKSLLLKLNDKHKFLSHSEVNLIKAKLIQSDHSNIDIISILAKLDDIINIIPIMSPLYQATISSNYGIRKHPIYKRNKFHCGSDMVGAKSSSIYASASGIITNKAKMKNYGNIVEIIHSNKFKTRYAHLKSIEVKIGEKVLRGQKIGTQGKSGNATNDHLHFEIWLDNKHIDPYDFIISALKL